MVVITKIVCKIMLLTAGSWSAMPRITIANKISDSESMTKSRFKSKIAGNAENALRMGLGIGLCVDSCIKYDEGS